MELEAQSEASQPVIIITKEEEEINEDDTETGNIPEKKERKPSLADTIRTSTSHTRFVFVQSEDLLNCYAQKIDLYEQEVKKQKELLKKKEALIREIRKTKLHILRLEKQKKFLTESATTHE